ncbi:MAG: dTMP kinase [bacterium]
MFISFEGIDKSGKSSQAELLAEYLEKMNYKVIRTCEPGGTQVGEKIKLILLRPSYRMSGMSELFLYLADRAEHVRQVIKPALESEKIVISDRFSDATVAYQGYGRGFDISWIEALNKRATQGILPEVTFLLDINPNLARQRAKKKDRMEREEIDFHHRVRQGYLELAKLHSERVKIMNGEGSPEEIHLAIRKIVLRYL